MPPHLNPYTIRVLDTSTEDMWRYGGVRCVPGPRDAMDGVYVGLVPTKEDRGLKCGFRHPDTLSFKL